MAAAANAPPEQLRGLSLRNPLVLAAVVWPIACVIYAAWHPPEVPLASPELIHEQLQRRIKNLPMPPESPHYQQYKQYYLQQYEQHMQEYNAYLEQWQKHHSQFNWKAFLSGLGNGVMVFAAAVAYCEYHYGAISYWMEIAEELYCASRERWHQYRERSRKLAESQKMESLIREIGEGEPQAPAAPSSSSASKAAGKKGKKKAAGEAASAGGSNGGTGNDTHAGSSSRSTLRSTDRTSSHGSTSEPHHNGDAPRSPQKPSAAHSEAPAPSSQDAAASTAARAPEGISTPQPQKAPELPGAMPAAARSPTAGVEAAAEMPTSGKGSQPWSSGPPRPADARERLRRKVVERSRQQKEQKTSKPAAAASKGAAAAPAGTSCPISSAELLREAEELLSQLEAEELLRQLEAEERKRPALKKKGKRKTAAADKVGGKEENVKKAPSEEPLASKEVLVPVTPTTALMSREREEEEVAERVSPQVKAEVEEEDEEEEEEDAPSLEMAEVEATTTDCVERASSEDAEAIPELERADSSEAGGTGSGVHTPQLPNARASWADMKDESDEEGTAPSSPLATVLPGSGHAGPGDEASGTQHFFSMDDRQGIGKDSSLSGNIRSRHRSSGGAATSAAKGGESWSFSTPRGQRPEQARRAPPAARQGDARGPGGGAAAAREGPAADKVVAPRKEEQRRLSKEIRRSETTGNPGSGVTQGERFAVARRLEAQAPAPAAPPRPQQAAAPAEAGCWRAERRSSGRPQASYGRGAGRERADADSSWRREVSSGTTGGADGRSPPSAPHLASPTSQASPSAALPPASPAAPRSWAQVVTRPDAGADFAAGPPASSPNPLVAAMMEELQDNNADQILEWFEANDATEWLWRRMPSKPAAAPAKADLLQLARKLLEERLHQDAAAGSDPELEFPCRRGSKLSKAEGAAAGELIRQALGLSGKESEAGEQPDQPDVEKRASAQSLRAEAPEFVPQAAEPSADAWAVSPMQQVVRVVPVHVVQIPVEGMQLMGPMQMAPAPGPMQGPVQGVHLIQAPPLPMKPNFDEARLNQQMEMLRDKLRRDTDGKVLGVGGSGDEAEVGSSHDVAAKSASDDAEVGVDQDTEGENTDTEMLYAANLACTQQVH